VARLGAALADSNATMNALGQRMTAAETAYRAIEGSRSWRLTRPLRVLAGALRRWMRQPAALLASIISIPGRAARAVAVATLARLRANPRHKARAADVLARFPTLNARLRAFARRTPTGQQASMRWPAQDTSPMARESDAPSVPSTGDVREAMSQAVGRWRAGKRVNG
jgi:hypothetical protein